MQLIVTMRNNDNLTSLNLKRSRRRHQNHNQTTQYQRARNQTHQYNAAPTRRKFAAYYIMLCLKVSVEPNEQHDDGDADERGAEGFPEVAEVVFGTECGGLAVVRGVGEGGVEAEELGDCDADGGEGEGGAEPGEEGSFQS